MHLNTYNFTDTHTHPHTPHTPTHTTHTHLTHTTHPHTYHTYTLTPHTQHTPSHTPHTPSHTPSHTHTLTHIKALNALADTVKSRLSIHDHQLKQVGLQPQTELLQHQLDSVITFGLKISQEDPAILQNAARDFAFSLAHIFTGALLLEHAAASNSTPNDMVTAQRWCSRRIPLGDTEDYSKTKSNSDFMLVMDGYGLDQRSKVTK